jgi:anti-sigma-K factor RskA
VNGHPQFAEDFDLYVLGAIEGEERETLELHLVHCAECRQKAEEARGRVALVALAAPAEIPPRGTRDRLLRRVRASAVLGASPRRVPWPRRMAAAFALATLVLAVIGGVQWRRNERLARLVRELELTQAQLEAQSAQARAVLEVLTSPDTIKVALVPSGARTVPQGRALYNAGKGRLLFYAANLPALPADRTYELWLIPAEGSPINAGIFQSDLKGNGQVLLPPLEPGVKPKAFAVTVEPVGGVPKPTGSMVLLGPAG